MSLPRMHCRSWTWKNPGLAVVSNFFVPKATEVQSSVEIRKIRDEERTRQSSPPLTKERMKRLCYWTEPQPWACNDKPLKQRMQGLGAEKTRGPTSVLGNSSRTHPKINTGGCSNQRLPAPRRQTEVRPTSALHPIAKKSLNHACLACTSCYGVRAIKVHAHVDSARSILQRHAAHN
jgi:hypothetical protein